MNGRYVNVTATVFVTNKDLDDSAVCEELADALENLTTTVHGVEVTALLTKDFVLELEPVGLF